MYRKIKLNLIGVKISNFNTKQILFDLKKICNELYISMMFDY